METDKTNEDSLEAASPLPKTKKTPAEVMERVSDAIANRVGGLHLRKENTESSGSRHRPSEEKKRGSTDS